LSSLYTTALHAATFAADKQNYPESSLFVIATPIGNLADISLRALHVLNLVHTIACEDTRHTQSLLRTYGVDKKSSQLLPVHQHNEMHASQVVIDRLRQGERVAYVSDAGTPAISDPGGRLVSAVRAAGLRVIPLPGPSSITTALSVAGITQDSTEATGFEFIGFLSSKVTERAHSIALLANQTRAIVILEAPHRIEALAVALSVLGNRVLTVCRELTKQFEEITNICASDFPAWLNADSNRSRGEFVLVLHPQPLQKASDERQAVLMLLLNELPLKTAVKLTAEITGGSRNELYELALFLKK